MKKSMIVSLLVIASVLVLGTTGFAYAQSQNPSTGTTDTMSGAQGGLGIMGSTFGAGSTGTASGTIDGLLHDYIVQAFADATGLTVEEIEARLVAGETLNDIAVSLGMTLDEFRTLIIDVRTVALNAAVADGVITQEQADWMLDHMSRMWQGDATGKNWGAGGQMGKGQMNASGSASCAMTGSMRGSGQGARGTANGTCTQTP